MKLYNDNMAPNPRRARIFIAEKGITIPMVNVNIAGKENRTDDFLAKNPLGLLPVLELDDGRMLPESTTICRYIEEMHPEPNLMGRDAWERATIDRWNRHMEFELFLPIAQTFRNTHPFWKGRIPQSPDYGEMCRSSAEKRIQWLNDEMAGREFVAGDRFTIADISALVAIDFGRISNIRIQPGQTNLERWHKAVSARPSAKA